MRRQADGWRQIQLKTTEKQYREYGKSIRTGDSRLRLAISMSNIITVSNNIIIVSNYYI